MTGVWSLINIDILGEKANIPENMQSSERYERAEEACDNLSEAVSQLEEVISYIEAAME